MGIQAGLLGIAILLLLPAHDLVRTLYRVFEDLHSKLVDRSTGEISEGT
ncbi:MAG: hypothetical protein NZ992_07445 [Candidatus Korarchaeum sp.]|nr:hypothetical protein [Candidatus Korarchaeum sp.]MDW8035361.1 hypothetical protein [Candidatus Korarchaeum sp.]